jgi:hypothetical protein
MDSSCRSPIMNLMEDQQAPQSAEGEAKVITLCGSTKFEAEFAEVNQRLTMEGCVVISLGMFSLPDLPDYDWTADSSDLKGRLGGVHFQKIRMADEVYIVDPGGYVGESTRREIAYAESLGKPVRYLSRERLARTGDGPQEWVRPGGPAHRQIRTCLVGLSFLGRSVKHQLTQICKGSAESRPRGQSFVLTLQEADRRQAASSAGTVHDVQHERGLGFGVVASPHSAGVEPALDARVLVAIWIVSPQPLSEQNQVPTSRIAVPRSAGRRPNSC